MDRNREIIKRRKAGETLQSIGYSFGISKQRVSAILKRHNSRRRKSLLVRVMEGLRGGANSGKPEAKAAQVNKDNRRCPNCGALLETTAAARRLRR
ncbi:hypothetical protein ACFLYM_00130 [Chloroflexota bacterium]